MVTENLLIERGYNGDYITSSTTRPTNVQIGQPVDSTVPASHTEIPSAITPTDPPVPPVEKYPKEVVVPVLEVEPAQKKKFDKEYSSPEKRGSGSSGSWPSWAYSYYPESQPTTQEKQDKTEHQMEDSAPIPTATGGGGGQDDDNTDNNDNENNQSPSQQDKSTFSKMKKQSIENLQTRSHPGVLSYRRTLHPPEPIIICPIGSLLFAIGFIFPPLWWIGSFYPRNNSTKIDRKWRRYNQLMSILSLFLIALILGLVIWYAKYYQTPDD